MQTPASSFGSLLRHHRMALGWTQERLAEEAGLSIEGISALERGKRRVPRADTVALLAGALGLEGDVRAGFEHAAAAARIKREEDQSPPLVPVPVTIHPASTPAKQAQHTRLGRRLLKVAAVPAVPVAFLLALLVARWAPVGRSQLTASGHPLAPTHLHLTAIWKPPALEPFTLREPRSVALELDGTLLIADYARATIVHVTSRGRLLAQLGGPGVAPGQFNRPTDITVDRQGNVYVADTGNNRVQELSPEGRPVRQWSDQPSLGKPLNQPQGIAVDGAGAAYIADTGNGRLVKVEPGGSVAWQRHLPAEAVAVDSSGQVLVLVAAEQPGSRPLVKIFSLDGREQGILRPCGHVASNPVYGNWLQWHIAVARRGVVYATDGTSSAAWSCGRSARSSRFSRLHFSAPAGIAVAKNGEMYVTEVATGALVRVTSIAQVRARWHALQPAITPFRAPSGIAVGPSGDIYVADTGNHRVVELSATGEAVRSWGGQGTGRGLFAEPTGVAVDRHGRIYVADTQRNAVSVLSSAGSLLQRWTGPLKAPTAIAVDRSGNVYVGDRTALTEFSPTGRIIKRMQAPVTGLATGDGGSVFLAAHLPSITEINGKGRTAAVYSMGAGAADAVAVGVRGTRYVLDTSAGRLSVMDSSGTLVQALGGRRTRPGGLSSPRALAAGAGGRVFVADTGNNRIVVFAPAPYVR